MPAGRPPKPTRLKLLDGSAKKDPQRINQHEPEPELGRPPKPEGLDEIASEAWDKMCVILEEMQIMTTADGAVVEMYARTYSQWRSACDDYERSRQEGGRNPHTTALGQSRDALLRIVAGIGCTPAARSKITVPKAGRKDPDSKFFG